MFTVSSFVKAVSGITMVREDGDLVASILQANGCIYDEAFSPTDAQIGVNEDNSLLLASHHGQDNHRWPISLSRG